MPASPLRPLLPLALTGLLAVATANAGAVVTYDAGLGVLPEARGWSFVDGSGAPAPTVSGGVLSPGATTNVDTRWWQRNDVPFAFDHGFTLEAVLRVVSSNYVANVGDGSQRSGFYLEAVDSTGRRLALGFASAGITVNTDGPLNASNGIPFLPFDTTIGFHRYLLAVQSDSAILSIDGIRRGATPLGVIVDAPTARRVYFGDGTSAAGSEVQIRLVRYVYANTPAAVDDPGAGTPGALRIAAVRHDADGGVELALSSAHAGEVAVSILDIGGRRVATLGTVRVGPGDARVRWSGATAGGARAAAGVYLAVATGMGQRAYCRTIVLH